MNNIPVITVDGPGGVGKGTLSRRLAQTLKWHFLDSGALYRMLALKILERDLPLEDSAVLAAQASEIGEDFDNPALRTEACGRVASQIAALPQVREALLERQMAFLKPPGLVADGRDMGTVVFPQADLKIFLDASAEERVKRRQMQLKDQGINVSLGELSAEIIERDKRDRQRAISPLKPAQDALIIDTTALSIQAVYDKVMAEVITRRWHQE